MSDALPAFAALIWPGGCSACCMVTAALPLKLGCGLVNLVLVPVDLLPFELPGVGADVVPPAAAFLAMFRATSSFALSALEGRTSAIC